MQAFHVIFKDQMTYSALELSKFIRVEIQINYVGVKRNGVFIQTSSNKSKNQIRKFFSKINTVNYVKDLKNSSLPNNMHSEVGRFNGNRIPEKKVDHYIGYDDGDEGEEFYCQAAHDDFADQHPGDY